MKRLKRRCVFRPQTIGAAFGQPIRAAAQYFMKNMIQYSTGLLSLISVLVSSDGEISEKELEYVEKIRQSEGIQKGLFDSIRTSILGKPEKEVYQIGIEAINQCSDAEKLRAFVKMYQMANADGIIHVKEVRLLLYAIKTANVDINMVVRTAEAASAVAVI